MRAISRLLADVKPTRFLEPNAPTGLCGLRTHPSPRSTLLYLYHSTLEKLEKLPKSSVYRQSTEALTRHRLEIIKGTKPNGWTAWQDKIQAILSDDVSGYDIKSYHLDGEIIVPKPFNELRLDLRPPKPQTEPMQPEGPRPWKPNQDVKLTGQDKKYDPKHELKKLVLDDEPPFTTEQISSLESQFGAGLLEEVIQVAEGEHKLVDEMEKAKVWEELEERAPEGQWTYFERPMSQSP